MPDGSQSLGWEIEEGCRYLFGKAGSRYCCALPCRAGSSYCPEHHALCHLPPGGRAESRRLRENEALATVVGGRRGRDAAEPPPRVFRRLLRVERLFLRPRCS